MYSVSNKIIHFQVGHILVNQVDTYPIVYLDVM